MCGSALFEPCGAAFCRVAPLQSLDSSSPSRFFSEYFPPAETGDVSCLSFSVQAAVGAIAARAHGLEAVLGLCLGLGAAWPLSCVPVCAILITQEDLLEIATYQPVNHARCVYLRPAFSFLCFFLLCRGGRG